MDRNHMDRMLGRMDGGADIVVVVVALALLAL